MPSAAIPLGEDIWRVPTLPWDLLNSFLVRHDDGSFTLVDTGLAKAPPRILEALREVGGDASGVSTIVLTHAHADHIGGAAELVRRLGPGVTTHPEDEPFATSGTAPPRDHSTRLGRLLDRSSRMGSAPVAATMTDGQLLTGSGLRVHHTPGHTPGHCSLLHERSGVLITGDAIWNVRSRRTWPILAFCTDNGLNERSAATLADLEYSTAAFTHGPDIRGTGRQEIRSFLARPRQFARLL